MINLGNTGTPFIIKELRIKQNTFLNDYYQCDIIPFPENGPPASSVSFKMKQALKAAIGEHLERTSVYVNNKRFKKQVAMGIDMVTKEEVPVPLQRLLLNWGLPIFSEVDLNGLVNDTCGLASHTSSFHSIKSAFLEFFERQCLLYNWFTCSPGTRINIECLLEDDEIKKLLRMAHFHVKEIHFFNISKSEDIKVIISIALGAETKGVGICADWDYKSAIIGSIKELFQYITVKQRVRNEEIGDNADLTDPLYYSKHFMTKVNQQTLRKDFNHLLSCSKSINIDTSHCTNITENEFNFIINRVSSENNIDLILCYIPALYKGLNTKIVKILTTKGFHHMYAPKIDPHQVPFLQSYEGQYFNIGKMIPFG